MVIGCFIESRLKLEVKGRSKVFSQEISVVDQVRNGGGLDYSEGSGGGEKWLNFVYILKGLLTDWIRGIRERVKFRMIFGFGKL